MDTTLISILEKLGAGAGIIVVLIILRLLVPWWVYAALLAENRELKRALEAAQGAQSTVKDILAALAFGQQHAGRAPENPALEDHE